MRPRFCDVANDFRVETVAFLASEQEIARIFVLEIRTKFRGLAIRVARDDQAVHLLERPTLANKLAGQPIEEFRMRGGRALRAKILLGFDKAATKIAHPNAIHLDTRS